MLGKSVSLVDVEIFEKLHGVGLFFWLIKLGDRKLLLWKATLTCRSPLECKDKIVLRQKHINWLSKTDISQLELIDYLSTHTVDDINWEESIFSVEGTYSEQVWVKILVDQVITDRWCGDVVLVLYLRRSLVLRSYLENGLCMSLSHIDLPDFVWHPSIAQLIPCELAWGIIDACEENVFIFKVGISRNIFWRVSMEFSATRSVKISFVNCQDEFGLWLFEIH